MTSSGDRAKRRHASRDLAGGREGRAQDSCVQRSRRCARHRRIGGNLVSTCGRPLAPHTVETRLPRLSAQADVAARRGDSFGSPRGWKPGFHAAGDDGAPATLRRRLAGVPCMSRGPGERPRGRAQGRMSEELAVRHTSQQQWKPGFHGHPCVNASGVETRFPRRLAHTASCGSTQGPVRPAATSVETRFPPPWRFNMANTRKRLEALTAGLSIPEVLPAAAPSAAPAAPAPPSFPGAAAARGNQVSTGPGRASRAAHGTRPDAGVSRPDPGGGGRTLRAARASSPVRRLDPDTQAGSFDHPAHPLGQPPRGLVREFGFRGPQGRHRPGRRQRAADPGAGRRPTRPTATSWCSGIGVTVPAWSWASRCWPSSGPTNWAMPSCSRRWIVRTVSAPISRLTSRARCTCARSTSSCFRPSASSRRSWA